MTTTEKMRPDELAAPLDLLLSGPTLGIRRRMTPNTSWLHLATSLVKQPAILAKRGGELAKELADVTRGRSDREPARHDKRFADPAWNENPVLKRVMQAYLSASNTAEQLLDDAHLDWRDQEKMRFVFDNLIEGASPTNNPLLNPLGYKALIDTAGMSAVRGVKAFARDMLSQPRVPSMVDQDAYSVGENVAVTPGSVVFKTRVFELIQYTPQTEKVSEVPLLLVPPVINKFYIMDIAPGRSMIEYFLQQGQQVFAISWRNPQARHRDWGFDGYGSAIIEAIDAVRVISGSNSTHISASCSGGILTAMVAAHLAAKGQLDKLASLTLMVTVLDQSRAGFASAALSERSARAAIAASQRKGYLDGNAMAEVFAWLRPTDLVWRYWVNNYIQGRSPGAFDVLYWNADTTRMAAALHRDMVSLGVDNALTVPGKATMLGTPIDLSTVTIPTYVVGGVADHISPWQATYRSARLLGSTDQQYVLSSSGHIAALVNPPGNPKASYRFGPADDSDPDQWMAHADKAADSWWPNYVQWLTERGGDIKDAPAQLGSRSMPPVASAPGAYVHTK